MSDTETARYTVATNGHDVLQNGWLFAQAYGVEPLRAQQLADALNERDTLQARVGELEKQIVPDEMEISAFDKECSVYVGKYRGSMSQAETVHQAVQATLEAYSLHQEVTTERLQAQVEQLTCERDTVQSKVAKLEALLADGLEKSQAAVTEYEDQLAVERSREKVLRDGMAAQKQCYATLVAELEAERSATVRRISDTYEQWFLVDKRVEALRTALRQIAAWPKFKEAEAAGADQDFTEQACAGYEDAIETARAALAGEPQAPQAPVIKVPGLPNIIRGVQDLEVPFETAQPCPECGGRGYRSFGGAGADGLPTDEFSQPCVPCKGTGHAPEESEKS